MALEITDATFEETVLKSDKPVVVDFWAAWCGPCRMVGPIIEQISEEYNGKGRERFCNADAQPLKEVNKWLKFYSQFWDDSLQDLSNYLNKGKS